MRPIDADQLRDGFAGTPPDSGLFCTSAILQAIDDAPTLEESPRQIEVQTFAMYPYPEYFPPTTGEYLVNLRRVPEVWKDFFWDAEEKKWYDWEGDVCVSVSAWAHRPHPYKGKGTPHE